MIFKNIINKYKKEKHGAMVIIMLAVIMMLSLPMIGVIYDYSMMRMAKQDLKNIQDLAGVACVAKWDNHFEPKNCKKVIMDMIDKNTSGGGDSHRADATHYLRQNCDGKSGLSGMTMNASSNTADGGNVVINMQEASKGKYTIQLRAYYKPIFLKSSLFKAFDKNDDGNLGKAFNDNCILIKTEPSTFMATYKK